MSPLLAPLASVASARYVDLRITLSAPAEPTITAVRPASVVAVAGTVTPCVALYRAVARPADPQIRENSPALPILPTHNDASPERRARRQSLAFLGQSRVAKTGYASYEPLEAP